MRIVVLSVLCFAMATCERTLFSVTTTSQNTNVSISFNGAGGKGTPDIPLNDSRVLPAANGAPEQVHLTYVNSASVVVSWATGQGNFTNGPLSLSNLNNTYGQYSTVDVKPDTSGKYPVKYGTSATNLSTSASGETRTYAQLYTGFVNDTLFANSNPTQNYSSPLLHHVQLSGLQPNTTYFYTVSGDSATSSTYNFTTPPALGSYPLRMGVFADVGQTYNSSDTMMRLLDSNPEILAFMGDWSYADDYTTTGTPLVIGYPNNTFTGNNISSFSGSFQTRWDTFLRLAAPLLSHIPIIPNAGNHELEPQGDGRYFETNQWGLDNGRQFNSYLSRFPITPLAYQSGGAPLYFSTDVGPVHYIVLNNYENFLVGSPQFAWLQNNLKTINRGATPWVVVTWHAPWYSSYTTHYLETESMRVSMEPLLYAAGVDIVLNGHLHEYERSHAIYNNTNNGCGTVHIVAGDGGNIEGLYTTFVDQLSTANGTSPYANCPKPGAAAIPDYQPGPYTPSFTYNLTNANNGYCPTPEEGQPKWSAFRQPAFGHGMLTFINETVAHWQWNRNIDASETDYPDDVYIVRDRTCFNFAGNGPALAPLVSPSAANYINQTAQPLPQIPSASLFQTAPGIPPSNRVTPGFAGSAGAPPAASTAVSG